MNPILEIGTMIENKATETGKTPGEIFAWLCEEMGVENE